MCGIVGYIGKEKKALDVLINGLEHLEYRGYDSSGVAYIYNNKLTIKKETGRIEKLKNTLNFNEKASIGIGHTRWATHGIPNKVNAHPHNYKDITIVHNGIIENYSALKKELQSKGYEFKSDTDTEVAVILLYDLYHQTNDVLKAIKEFKLKAQGAYAIGLICSNEMDTLYAIKKNSPLIIGVGKKANYLASDVPAIVDYTNQYIILNDGDYAKVTQDKIIVYNDKNKEIIPTIKTFEAGSEMVSKNGYDHYMLKEIYEEAEVIKRSAHITKVNLRKYQKIVIVACGSAMHAGLVGKYLIEKYAGIPTEVEIASEFRYKKIFINKKTLVIAISQSGETADTLEAVKIAKKYHSDTLGIINVKESSIAREVKYVIYTEAGREVAVATTKAYLAQVLVLALLAYLNAENKELEVIKTLESDLKELPILIESLLAKTDAYQRIAKKIYHRNDIFYIGRGIDYALCMEASLKLKEISYIHSEAYAAGELKHGTISLVEEGTPIIGIVTDKSIADKTISNLKEVKARGAYVIYIITDELDTEGDFYDDKIVIPTTNPILEPMPTIVPMQLIAYYVAKLNKCDIDKPKNLAKSVTVE